MMHSSVQRLAIAFSSSLLVAMAGTYFLLSFSVSSIVERQITTSLNEQLIALLDTAKTFPVVSQISVIDQLITSNNTQSYYALRGMDGQIVFGNLAVWPNSIGSTGIARHPTDNTRMIVHSAWIDENYELLVAKSLAPVEQAKRDIRRSVFAITLILTLILAGLALYYRRWQIRRANQINHVLTVFADGDYSSRSNNNAESDDEFAELERNVDQTLDRIVNLVTALRRATDYTAHQLRKPLSGLRRGLSDLASYDDAHIQEKASALLTEADGLLHCFDGLLDLPEIETAAIDAATPCELGTIVAQAISLYEDVAEDRAVKLVGEIRPITIMGEAILISELCNSLIDNAIKYSPSESTILIESKLIQDMAVVCVSDQGPGIPPDKLEAVLSPLVRVNSARVAADGYGLGLALVNAIVKRHRGSIKLENLNPGLKVTVFFPYKKEGSKP